MTDILSLPEIKRELVRFVRNSDVFTITQRSVTTDTDTGTFAADATHLIAVTDVKNIRSIIVGGVTLNPGSEYTYNTNFLDTTIKTKITFIVAQTGAYTISYDYGTDKIFPDFPKSSLTIGSFPRIGCDVINIPTQPGGFGNVNVSTVDMTIVVYDRQILTIADYIHALRTAIIAAQTSFHFMGLVVKPVEIGPVLQSLSDKGRNKVFQQNLDIRGSFNYEKN